MLASRVLIASFTVASLTQSAFAALVEPKASDFPKIFHPKQSESRLRDCVSAAVRSNAPVRNAMSQSDSFVGEDGKRSVIVSGLHPVKHGFHEGTVVSYKPDEAGPASLVILYTKTDPQTANGGPRDAYAILELNRVRLDDAPNSIRNAGKRASEADRKLVRDKAYDVSLSLRTCMRSPARENLSYPPSAFPKPNIEFKLQ